MIRIQPTRFPGYSVLLDRPIALIGVEVFWEKGDPPEQVDAACRMIIHWAESGPKPDEDDD